MILSFCRYGKCDEYISDLDDGKLQAQPGCTEEETLEVGLTYWGRHKMVTILQNHV